MNFILIGYLSNAEMAEKTLCQKKKLLNKTTKNRKITHNNNKGEQCTFKYGCMYEYI